MVNIPQTFPNEGSKLSLEEAKRHLKTGTDTEISAFAERQLAARYRLYDLVKFYRRNPCRLAKIHLLTASCVAISRFCGFSKTFNALGAAIMPVDRKGMVRHDRWAEYVEACENERPLTLRDELWLEAHSLDWRHLLETGLDTRFLEEAKHKLPDKNWQLMLQHTDITVSSRQWFPRSDKPVVPLETAMSKLLGKAMLSAWTRGLPVIFHYLKKSAQAVILPSQSPHPELPGYRQIACTLTHSFFASASGWKVYRRGLRIKNRGVRCVEKDWPILETVMGKEADAVHPMIKSFYRNPGRFKATAELDIKTLPLLCYSRMAALLVGQGLFESDLGEIPAQLKVFQREDGSMHFVRELYCRDKLRVFDSDFVVKNYRGKPSLIEEFRDIGVSVVLNAQNRPNGGVAVVGETILWHGIPLPGTPLKIVFESRVSEHEGNQQIVVHGSLTMDPRNAVEKFIIFHLLKRPRDLGGITYRLTEASE